MLDADANRELFEEQFEIIMKAFNEPSFSHRGKHYTLPPEVPYRGYQLQDITLVPRPFNLPVETWQPMVSGSERGLNFMAKHGIKGVILGTAAEYIEGWMQRFQDVNARHGRDLALGENLALGCGAISIRAPRAPSGRWSRSSRSTSSLPRRSACCATTRSR